MHLLPHFTMLILNYILDAILSSLFQLLVLFGPFLILALLMSQVSRLIELNSIKLIGTKAYLYSFGWLGTSVHEIGHAIFCPLFGHKITEMKLFSMDYSSGIIGYVNHSYNPRNIYHNIGNFFIGVGPIILGSLVLYGIIWWMYGVNIMQLTNIKILPESFTNINDIKSIGNSFSTSLKSFFEIVFNGSTSKWWKTLIFIYLIFSIGVSINLSKPDIKNAYKGFLYIIAIIFIINLTTNWLGDYTTNISGLISGALSGFYFILICTIGINIIFMLILVLLRRIFKS